MLKIYAPDDDNIEIFDYSGRLSCVYAQFGEALHILLNECGDPAAALFAMLRTIESYRDDNAVYDAIVAYMKSVIDDENNRPKIIKM